MLFLIFPTYQCCFWGRISNYSMSLMLVIIDEATQELEIVSIGLLGLLDSHYFFIISKPRN